MNAYLPVMRTAVGLALTASLGAASVYLYQRPTEPQNEAASCCALRGTATEIVVTQPPLLASSNSVAEVISQSLIVPDTLLFDQRGRPVRFYTDLVRGQVVAINFIFTSCKGVCPPLGASFGKLEASLKGKGVRLISVSVDPVNDTSERLETWARQFDAGPDWTLVTGAKQDVDGLLRSLGVFSADKADHSPFVLIGNDRAGAWRRIHGLSPIERIRDVIEEMGSQSIVETDRMAAADDLSPDTPAGRYFTDVPLANQYGKTMRLYSDLLRDKVVVINVFFTSCKNTCPVMMSSFQRLQEHLGNRLGRDVHLLSFTVDPENDDVQTLRDYAKRVDAHPGWFLLTGSKENLALALAKLGLAASRREEHSNIFIIGNDATHLWKKVRGLAQVEQTIASLDEVIEDRRGEPRSDPPEQVIGESQ
jgi:protein SCO1